MRMAAAHSHTTKRRAAPAQGAVEFALVGLAFFMLVFGTIEFGLFMWTNHTLANGAREGVRYAVVHGSKSSAPATDAIIETEAEKTMAMVDLAGVTFTVTGEGGDPGENVVVTVTYSYTPITLFMFGGEPLTITHTSTGIIQH